MSELLVVAVVIRIVILKCLKFCLIDFLVCALRWSLLCFCQSRLLLLCRSPFFFLFICYQSCAYDILKTNELSLLQIGTSGLLGRRMKGSTFGVKGQSHMTQKLYLETKLRHRS